ncbi:MAG: hypothetical protein H7Z21_19830 [Hymenobacter sp.]|nr:hypothetical protein [Hymenobacter sp.]
MKKTTALLFVLGALCLANAAGNPAQAGPGVLDPAETIGLPETVKALPPSFKATWRKPTLHRPNYTYYKGDKKRKGFFKLLSFGK